MREERILGATIATLILFVGFLITVSCVHSCNYVCVRGHYETIMTYNPALKMMMPETIWICDAEVKREEFEKQNH